MEIDEMDYQELPDGRIQVTFVTSGVVPTTAKIKTILWSIFGLPVQKVDSVEIYEEAKGPLIKRYKVVVVLKPALEGIRRGEGLGVLDVLTNKNVKFYTR